MRGNMQHYGEMGSVQHHTNKVTHPMRARRHARGITTPGYNYCCSSYPFHQQRERKETTQAEREKMKERKELAEKERKDTEGEKEREAKPEKRKYE